MHLIVFLFEVFLEESFYEMFLKKTIQVNFFFNAIKNF